MGEPQTWAWVWLLVTGAFVLGEMLTPGTFFLLPFAFGALAAALAGFAGAAVGVQWLVFVGVTVLASFSFLPLRRRLDRTESVADGIGARRLMRQPAVVLRSIPAGPDAMGMVRVGREEWRAMSSDHREIPEGSMVEVVEVRGTGVVVSLIPAERGAVQ